MVAPCLCFLSALQRNKGKKYELVLVMKWIFSPLYYLVHLLWLGGGFTLLHGTKRNHIHYVGPCVQVNPNEAILLGWCRLSVAAGKQSLSCGVRVIHCSWNVAGWADHLQWRLPRLLFQAKLYLGLGAKAAALRGFHSSIVNRHIWSGFLFFFYLDFCQN